MLHKNEKTNASDRAHFVLLKYVYYIVVTFL